MLEMRGSKWLGIVLLLMSTALHARYGGGTGEPNDPYLIYTAEQMNAIGAEPNDWDKHFKLRADIDLSAYAGEQFNVIGRAQGAGREMVMTPFTGVFDGNDHALSNFTWKSAGRNYVGIFGCVGAPAAEIRDLHILDPNVTAEEGASVGSLVGYFASGIITNCSVHGGSIAGGSSIGALAGTVSATLAPGRYKPGYIPIPGGAITGCHADSNVVGDESVGGLVGSNAGPITDCDARGNIIGRNLPPELPAPSPGDAPQGRDSPVVTYSSAIGGLVGSNWGTVTEAHADANVVGSRLVGGLVGDNYATITRCYASGSTTGTSAVGNLVGQNYEGTITDCNSTGTVSGTWDVGGLAGSSYYGGTLQDCYSSSNVTGQRNVGGLAGSFGPVTHITRCRADGTVVGTWYVGGLVGESLGTITHCQASGTVTGNLDVGGLAGNSSGTLEDCYASGMVTGQEWVGGLAGESGGTITRCRATGDVTGDEWASRNLGGLAGGNGAAITASYATGTVRGAQGVGGLVGYHTNYRGITNCYSRGMVWGTENVGAFAGGNSGAVTNCYATGLTIGTEFLGGLIGGYSTSGKSTVTGSFWDAHTTRQATSIGGTAKSTLQMQSADTFLGAGWDFVGETPNGTEDIWWIEEGRDYPRLTWELQSDSPIGDMNREAETPVPDAP